MAKLNINGTVRDVTVEADTPLLWVIREHVGLTGTKYGCGVAQCGACSVHINDEVQRSCSIAVGDVKATDMIVTIEGLSATSSHPVQKAWAAVDVPQCGYCQSGQIMAAAALLKKTPKPTDKDIDEAMTNICRCGTYQRIRQAVHLAAGAGTTGRAREVSHEQYGHRKSTILSRRKFIVGSAAMAGGGLALGLNVPFGVGSASAQGGRDRSQHLGCDQARRYLRDPHRAFGDGAGNAHGTCTARGRGTGVRLEKGDDRRHHAGPQPRQ